jgi:hypothetical protein
MDAAMTNPKSTAELAGLIQRKLSLLEQMRVATIDQCQRVASLENDALLGVLARKQNLLAELQEVQIRLEPFRDQDPESRNWLSPDTRAKARAAAERCQQLIQELIQLENRSIGEMTARREGIASHLHELGSAHAARMAYQQSDADPNQDFFDSPDRFDGAS